MEERKSNENQEIQDQIDIVSKNINDILEMKLANNKNQIDYQDQINLISESCSNLIKSEKHQPIIETITNLIQNRIQIFHSKLNENREKILAAMSELSEIIMTCYTLFPIIFKSLDEYFKTNKSIEIINDELKKNRELFQSKITSQITSVIQAHQNKLDLNIDYSKSEDKELAEIKHINELYDKIKYVISDEFYDYIESIETSLEEFYDTFFSINYKDSDILRYLRQSVLQHDHDKQLFEYLFGPEESTKFTNLCEAILIVGKEPYFIKDGSSALSLLVFEDPVFSSQIFRIYTNFGGDLSRILMESIEYASRQIQSKAEPLLNVKTNNRRNNTNILTDFSDEVMKFRNRFTSACEDEEMTIKFDDEMKKIINDEKYKVSYQANKHLDQIILSLKPDLKKEIQALYPIIKYIYEEEFIFHYKSFYIQRIIKTGKHNDTQLEMEALQILGEVVSQIKERMKDIFDDIGYSNEFKNIFLEAEQSIDINYSINPLIFRIDKYPLKINTEYDAEQDIPLRFRDINRLIEDFYMQRNQSMRIRITSSSLCTLSLKFPKKKRAFCVTADLPCACVILMLAERSVLTFDEIVQQLFSGSRITAQHAIINLGTSKIVLREGTTNRLSGDDKFRINENFNNKTSRFIIPPVHNEIYSTLKEYQNSSNAHRLIDEQILIQIRSEPTIDIQNLRIRVIGGLMGTLRCTERMVDERIFRLEEQGRLRIQLVSGQTLIRYIP